GSAPGKCASRSPFLPVTAGRRGPTWTPGHMDSWPAREEAAMITVHHLNNSRSQRILWLLEELGLDYEVVRYQRDAETMAAPAELRDVHPLGKAPVVVEGGEVLGESGAIVELLLERHGPAGLLPKRGTPAHRDYLYWLHYAEGSLMPQLLLKLYLDRVGKPAGSVLERVQEAVSLHLHHVEQALQASGHFAGGGFSAADIQMSTPLEVAR